MNSDNLRDLLNSFVADLRSKRVLPIVVLLIAAAIAIPLLLSHSGKAASLSPLPPAPTVTAPNPSTALSAGRPHEPRQNYLTGPAHNPFISNTTTDTATTSAATTSATGASTSTTGGSTSTTGGSTSTTGGSASGTSANGSGSGKVSSTCPNGQQPVDADGHELCLICKHAVAALIGSQLKCLTPGAACDATDQATYNEYGFSCVSGRLRLGSGRTTTTATTTATQPLPYSNYEVEATILQAGVSSTPTVFHNLSRDELLPTASSAFATFLGVRTDRQTAVFVLSDDTTVTGEGNCAPSATTCTFLTLIPGQSARVVVTPSGSSSPETFTLRYGALRKVSSSASVITIDPTGAADVKAAESYVPALKTASYDRYTGLLSIKLGSTVPVTP
jgi:hypothetical protein